jgi:hypothetical protein
LAYFLGTVNIFISMREVIRKLLREGLSTCDNLFTNDSDNSNHKIALSKDLYYYVIKNKRVTLEHMSPEEFFNEIGGLEYHMEKNIDYDTVKTKIANIKNGDKMPIPYLMYNSRGNNIGHEGRHRIIAAMEMGCNSVPVMVDRDVSDSDVMALANKVGDLELDDMIKELRVMGFKNFDEFYINRIAYILRASKEKGYLYIP